MITMELPVVIITGASSGIGRATALHFAKKNCRLSLSGRDVDALTEVVKECINVGEDLTSSDVIITIGDLREEEVAKKLINHTIDSFSRIDCLFPQINSAGILVTGEVVEAPITDYDRQFDVNVRSVIQLTKLAIPYIVAVKGTIVNVSSVAGTCSFPNVTYYCMSKAALDQFTKCLALELAPKGVRVNSVNPGVIVTNVHKRAGMSETEYKDFLKRAEGTHALGRVGYTDEVAEAIYFFAFKQSSFSTGELLHVDGGRHLMIPR